MGYPKQAAVTITWQNTHKFKAKSKFFLTEEGYRTYEFVPEFLFGRNEGLREDSQQSTQDPYTAAVANLLFTMSATLAKRIARTRERTGGSIRVAISSGGARFAHRSLVFLSSYSALQNGRCDDSSSDDHSRRRHLGCCDTHLIGAGLSYHFYRAKRGIFSMENLNSKFIKNTLKIFSKNHLFSY